MRGGSLQESTMRGVTPGVHDEGGGHSTMRGEVTPGVHDEGRSLQESTIRARSHSPR